MPSAEEMREFGGEPETIEGEIVSQPEPGTDLEPVIAASPATLFRTDEPTEIITKATNIANALTEVLRSKNLTSNISGKDYVRVEGWELCGTMLGVFAVIEWSRPVEGGWEARAEARTLSGAVVGAAEAQCLRSESKWKSRDDYALRSMAQTRAVSKALRAPLGFIVTMAGFEATPAEEIPTSDQTQPQTRRREGPAPFPVPKSWVKVEEAVKRADNPDEAWALFQAFLRAAAYHLFGEADQSKISKEQRLVLLQKAAGAVVWLHENVPSDGPFFYFDEASIRRAWAAMLEGHLLEIPDYKPVEPPEADAEAERIAQEVFADDASNPYP